MAIPWGAVASVGGSILSGMYGSNEADQARAFQKEVLQNQIQWKVADLKAAGLNPILASGMNTAVPGGTTAQMPDLGQSITRALATAKENKLIEQQIDIAGRKVEAEIRLLDAQTQNLQASATESTTRTESGIYQMEALYKQAQTEVADSQSKLNMQMVQESLGRLQQMAVQREALKAEIENTNSSTALYQKERELKELDKILVAEKTKTEGILQKLEGARTEGERVRTAKEKASLPQEQNKARWHGTNMGLWFDAAHEAIKAIIPFFK